MPRVQRRTSDNKMQGKQAELDGRQEYREIQTAMASCPPLPPPRRPRPRQHTVHGTKAIAVRSCSTGKYTQG